MCQNVFRTSATCQIAARRASQKHRKSFATCTLLSIFALFAFMKFNIDQYEIQYRSNDIILQSLSFVLSESFSLKTCLESRSNDGYTLCLTRQLYALSFVKTRLECYFSKTGHRFQTKLHIEMLRIFDRLTPHKSPFLEQFPGPNFPPGHRSQSETK